MGDLTLDINEVQVLVNFPADADGFYWHHRVILCRIEGSRWLAFDMTPDLDIVQHDLGTLLHSVLDRRAPFPGDILDEVYAHDPIGKAALSGYKRQAQTMAVILGEGTLPDSDSTSWVVADVNHVDFGREIEEHLLHNPATGLAFATRGIIIREGEELFVEKIPTANLDTTSGWSRSQAAW